MSTIPPPAPGAAGSIPNHLAWAIVSTILGTCLCCPLGLLGIVGIVHASKVNSLLAQGDHAGAQSASNTAKTWCWVATALAIIGLLFTIYGLITGQSAAQYQQIMEMMQQAQSAN